MNIIDKRAIGDREFNSLRFGDVFADENNVIYMKMYPCSYDDGHVFNAVNLHTGEVEEFEFENMVTLVRATLTITDNV